MSVSGPLCHFRHVDDIVEECLVLKNDKILQSQVVVVGSSGGKSQCKTLTFLERAMYFTLFCSFVWIHKLAGRKALQFKAVNKSNFWGVEMQCGIDGCWWLDVDILKCDLMLCLERRGRIWNEESFISFLSVLVCKGGKILKLKKESTFLLGLLFLFPKQGQILCILPLFPFNQTNGTCNFFHSSIFSLYFSHPVLFPLGSVEWVRSSLLLIKGVECVIHLLHPETRCVLSFT